MTPENYVELAKCTEPDSEAYENVIMRWNNPDMFDAAVKTLRMVAQMCASLDDYKKAIFYGNPMELKESDTQVFEADETFIRLVHVAMGLATEAGEVIEALIKHIDGEELDLVNVSEEIGDSLWYAAIGSDVTDVKMSDIMLTNIKKLEKRFGDKFTEKSALIRDLESERKILEEGME